MRFYETNFVGENADSRELRDRCNGYILKADRRGYFQNDERAVVEGVATTGEAVDLFEDAVGDSVGGQLLILGDEIGHTVVAEEFTF